MQSWQSEVLAKFDELIALRERQPIGKPTHRHDYDSALYDLAEFPPHVLWDQDFIREVNFRLNEMVALIGQHLDPSEEFTDEHIDFDTDLWLGFPPSKDELAEHLNRHPMMGLTAVLLSALKFYRLPLDTTLMPAWTEDMKEANKRLWASERAIQHSLHVGREANLAGENRKIWYTKNRKNLPWVKAGDK